MAETPRRILELPLDTRKLITSSVQITSLIDVVLELVKNSLDAQATHIRISVDFVKGCCSVQDDGVGIRACEFDEGGGLGNMYYTSKLDTRTDHHGRFGRFLASLSNVALLIITSSTLYASSARAAIVRNGQRVATESDLTALEAADLAEHGTKVVVHNLFSNMPVRVTERLKRFDRRGQLTKEFHRLQRRLVGLLLPISRPAELTLRNTHDKHHNRIKSYANGEATPVFELGRISALFSHVDSTQAESSQWQIVTGKADGLSIQAAFCRQPVPTKDTQFISVGIRPLDDHPLFDEVNALFDSSSFGTRDTSGWLEDRSPARCLDTPRHTLMQSRGSAKSMDRWPMFYVKIDAESDTENILKLQDDLSGYQPILERISAVLKIITLEFLRANSILASKHPDTRSKSPSAPSTEMWSGRTPDLHSIRPRLRSAKGTYLDNILTGLPFVEGADQDGNEVAEHVHGQRATAEGGKTDPSFQNDDTTPWIDPSTGKTFMLNARTGMVVPDLQGKRKQYSDAKTAIWLQRRKLVGQGSRSAKEAIGDLGLLFKSAKSVEIPIGSMCMDKCGAKGSILCGETVVSDGSSLESADKEHQGDLGNKISKMNFGAMRVLGQVDKKFILGSIRHSLYPTKGSSSLVLIDQHAADERVKLETLFAQICSGDAVYLSTPICFDIDREEARRLKCLLEYFQSWYMHMTIDEDEEQSHTTVFVSRLPQLIAERCRMEPKLLIALIRTEIWSNKAQVESASRPGKWLTRITDCPQGILDMLISRACRTAIMFNDVMSHEECQLLVRQLGQCLFPFQCAHGRPSMTVLAQLDDPDVEDARLDRDHFTFGKNWKVWIGEK